MSSEPTTCYYTYKYSPVNFHNEALYWGLKMYSFKCICCREEFLSECKAVKHYDSVLVAVQRIQSASSANNGDEFVLLSFS